MAAEGTELGVAARLPDAQSGRGGDGPAAEESRRRAAAQDTELGVAARLPYAHAGRGGGVAAAEEGELGVAAQLPDAPAVRKRCDGV